MSTSQDKPNGVRDNTSEHDAIDIDIVAASYRTLSDATGFDDMIEAWQRKFELLDPSSVALESNPRLTQVLKDLQKHLVDQPFIFADEPIDRAIARARGEAFVLDESSIVVATNAAASLSFGAVVGRALGEEWLDARSRAEFRKFLSDEDKNRRHAICRLERPDDHGSLAEIFELEVPGHAGRYIVIKSLDLPWNDDLDCLVEEAFGLSPSEIEIAKAVFRTFDLRTIAQERGRSLETVRTQVKSILSKTGASNQVELVRILSMLCASGDAPLPQDAASWTDPFGNERILRRPDGRRLAYTFYGPEDGMPVLFTHGLIPLWMLPRAARDMLADAGLRVIALSLPGHGNSDAGSAIEPLADASAAITEFCDAAGLQSLVAVSSDTGTFGLVKTAQQRPDLIARMLMIGFSIGSVPRRLKNMPVLHQTLTRMARHQPWLLDLVTRAAMRLIRQRGVDFYYERDLASSPFDLEFLRRMNMQPLMRSAVQPLLSQGPHAFKNEVTIAATHQMIDILPHLDAPVHWLVAQYEPGFDPQEQREVAAMSDMVTVEVVRDAGSLLCWQRADAIAAHLIAMAKETYETGVPKYKLP